ncbi:molybdopterin-dependent oxidoreductase [Phenylobacterium sp. J367]|uniref:molybdopterin-dependent oxidoreductase n=1 Tax=Phenylobacterium sp. J367 TaxID=2898435 RepID=UPI002150F78B|nr:molybdopterin-dependent oxidoreductase [Phenylobacterium sp. J367]
MVFHCADHLGPNQDASDRYYESIDLIDAYHPQTILAYGMNDAPLGVPHGAPVRLRVERQLGYKHAKYVQRIEAVADLSGLYGGKGGFWEDRGYEWYAGDLRGPGPGARISRMARPGRTTKDTPLIRPSSAHPGESRDPG